SAPDCGVTLPTPTGDIGFPDMHIVFNDNGTCPGGTPTPTPTPTPSVTPSVTPTPTASPTATPTPTATPAGCVFGFGYWKNHPDALIGDLVVPPVGDGYLAPRDVNALKDILEDYNEGQLCAPSCEPEGSPPPGLPPRHRPVPHSRPVRP